MLVTRLPTSPLSLSRSCCGVLAARPVRRFASRTVTCKASSARQPPFGSPEEQHWPRSSRQKQEAPQLPSDPTETLRTFFELVKGGNSDALLEFLPDEVIDRALEHSKLSGKTEDLQLEDILRTSSHDLLYLDTYALRNLVYASPESVRVLSSMQVSADKFLQRCAIVAPSGEECVLTFTLSLQEAMESQYRGPPLVTRKWMLSAVVGECNSHELPAHPSPSFPPEAVVEAQLQALRECKVASVFAHASPENKAATGPVEHFAALLRDNPIYSPLLNHAWAETVHRLQPSETLYMEVIRVCPAQAKGQKRAEALLYMWIVSRQGPNSNWASCWMTDAVQLVNMFPDGK